MIHEFEPINNVDNEVLGEETQSIGIENILKSMDREESLAQAKSTDSELRSLAILSLAKLGDSRDLAVIFSATDDDSERVRISAYFSLIEASEATAIEFLQKKYQRFKA